LACALAFLWASPSAPTWVRQLGSGCTSQGKQQPLMARSNPRRGRESGTLLRRQTAGWCSRTSAAASVKLTAQHLDWQWAAQSERPTVRVWETPSGAQWGRLSDRASTRTRTRRDTPAWRRPLSPLSSTSPGSCVGRRTALPRGEGTLSWCTPRCPQRRGSPWRLAPDFDQSNCGGAPSCRNRLGRAARDCTTGLVSW
jgi:hypothetical protein